MNEPSYLGLIHNIALLLALVLLFEFTIGKRHISITGLWQVLLGISIGSIGVILMMTPWVLVPGVIFDTRSVLLGISGLFFGTIPTIIAIVITAVYRLYLGGAAAGMGVSVIVCTGFIGILWGKKLRKPLNDLTWWELYLFGITIHLVMLLCAFILPLDTALEVLSDISLPVMLIYPIGTLLLGLIMTNRLRREQTEDELKRAEARMRSLIGILQHPVKSVQEFLDFALEQAVHLTGSRAGYIFHYSEDNQQFELKAITKSPFAENALPNLPGSHTINDVGLLGEAVRRRQPIIVNEDNAAVLQNIPQGHIPIQKYLSVPVFNDQKIVALVGVANKANTYDESDVLQLTLLMDGVWKASERKLAEEALRQSEERYKTIIDNLPNGLIHILDPDFRYVFNAGEGMAKVGLTNGILVGKTIYDILGLETGEKVAGHYRRVLEGEAVRFEGNYGGQEFIVHAAPLRNNQGEVSQILTLSFIITERKQSEEKLRLAQVELQQLLEESDLSRRTLLSVVEDQKQTEEKLQQLNLELESRVRERTIQLEMTNKELEAFAYSVSHDLRAPLRALDGFSSALITDYQTQLDTQGRHYLTRIQEASHRMGQLIEDLLRLSRITRREMAREQVNISQIVQKIASELTRQNPDRKVEFEIVPDVIVDADPNLMRIALENLLNNAFKFTSHRDCGHILFGKTDQNGESIYYIRDDGAGFSMEYADKLFTPFQRLHSAQEFPGTGIGLVTVQRIIAKHGGRIWPEASPGTGATFYFTLGDN
jgi:PAS domain S-box-containing protein